MIKKVITKNIYKLLDYWDLTVNDLARKTEISLPGLKKMLKSGSYKIENLSVIADALGVTIYLLLADEIEYHQKKTARAECEIIGYYTSSHVVMFEDTNNMRLLPVFSACCSKAIIYDERERLRIESNYKEAHRIRLEDEIESLKSQIADKNEIISLLKESLKK